MITAKKNLKEKRKKEKKMKKKSKKIKKDMPNTLFKSILINPQIRWVHRVMAPLLQHHAWKDMEDYSGVIGSTGRSVQPTAGICLFEHLLVSRVRTAQQVLGQVLNSLVTVSYTSIGRHARVNPL